MKAKDLQFSDLISLEPGEIKLRGRRLVLHSIHAFSQFRFDILNMLGWEQARRLFTRFGFFWGQADAAALQRSYKWPNREEWIRAGLRLHALEGVVRSSINELTIEAEPFRFYMDVNWHDSVEVEEHLMEADPGDEQICWKLTGYLSGLTSYCLGQSIYFMEADCQGKQATYCRAVGRDLDSWGDEIAPYLTYFEADDIEGRVKKLTRQLREKSRELKAHQRTLEQLHHKSVPYLVEGRSKAMQEVLDLAGRVAQFDTSVIVTGETGTGKEVLARYIHEMSKRSGGPFVAVNCGALPESLLDSELFGHRAGSFTGAVRDRVGLVEEAAGGTVFLDEIGDISPAMQLKILRVLQEKEIVRVGENRPRKVDVRIIAATNKDLAAAVAEERFREDLLYRLRVVEVALPSLRQRPEDILPLARHLVERIKARLGLDSLRLDGSCAEHLTSYPWPGNIRELDNALERAAVVSAGGVILPEHLPAQVVHQSHLHRQMSGSSVPSLQQVELAHIERVLELTGGNRKRAAAMLGISPTTLWRKMKEL
ncbi:AAA domain-containing protein [candidate division GN15 bacterium]|nr:AAA domain-containing protein [candidate division GN15 bacterium]